MSRKEDLLVAATLHFSEKGYHRTSVSDIVATANVAQGTFYLYFNSKKEIFITLLERFVSLLEIAVQKTNFESADITSAEEVAIRVKAAIRSVFAMYQENAILARIFLRDAMGLDPDFVEVREGAMLRQAQYAAAIMDLAVAHGALPPQNSLVIARCIVGMIEHVASYWLFHADDLSLDDVVNTVTRFEMLGVAGEPSAPMKAILS